MTETEKEYHSHVEKTLKRSLVILAIVLVVLFLGWGDLFLWGVAVGLVAAIINTCLLVLRINSMAKIALHSAGYANLFMLMGFGFRWVLIGLVCLLAIKTGWFSLIGMMVGFLLPTVLSAGESIRGLLVCRVKESN